MTDITSEGLLSARGTLLDYIGQGNSKQFKSKLLTVPTDKRSHVINLLGENAPPNWSLLMVALYCAVNAEGIGIAKYILSQGGNPNYQSEDGNAPMFVAVSENNSEQRSKKVKMLIDSNCALNIRGENGITPLMLACESGDIKTVNAMIKSGADLYAKDVFGNNCLYYSQHSKNPGTEVSSLIGKLILDEAFSHQVKSKTKTSKI